MQAIVTLIDNKGQQLDRWTFIGIEDMHSIEIPTAASVQDAWPQCVRVVMDFALDPIPGAVPLRYSGTIQEAMLIISDAMNAVWRDDSIRVTDAEKIEDTLGKAMRWLGDDLVAQYKIEGYLPCGCQYTETGVHSLACPEMH